MKRISLAAGVVLLVLLTAVAVGNHSAVGAGMPPRVEWKAVPYGPVTTPSFAFTGGGTSTLASPPFTAPEDGFVWLNSTGLCNSLPAPITGATAIIIGWRPSATLPTGTVTPLPGDWANNIVTGTTGGISLPYSASAVFPVSAGMNTLVLEVSATIPMQCSGVNVVMFTNTQLP